MKILLVNVSKIFFDTLKTAQTVEVSTFIEGGNKMNEVKEKNSIISLAIESELNLISFSTINELYKKLSKYEKEKFNDIEVKYAGDLARILYYFRNDKENPDYQGIHATLELQAISLRLSRHHIKRARVIENVAHFFVEILILISKSNDIVLKFLKAEYIDRPSMMVINRMINLLEENENINFHFVMEKDVLSSPDNSQLDLARKQLFSKLNIEIEVLETTSSKYLLDQQCYNYETLNASIIEQNFELAILILHKLLEDPKRFISKQLVYRYLAVIEANLGNYDNALEFLDTAIENSKEILEYSCNNYIKSLCLIKRKQNTEQAIIILENTLQKLNENWEENNFKYMHEKAWLINGMCLARTILASKLSKEERDKELISIIQLEMEAYRLINGVQNFRVTYLKFNLLANIAFVLEIMEQYEEAINFWKRAFAPLLREGEYYDGEKDLSYRLGILNIRLKDYEKAKDFLERSYYLASVENNPFHKINILYSLGYLEYQRKEYVLAQEYFVKGMELCLFMKDKFNLRIFNHAIQVLKEKLVEEELIFPMIKLTSYVPYLDLSFVPEIDLNKALVRKK